MSERGKKKKVFVQQADNDLSLKVYAVIIGC